MTRTTRSSRFRAGLQASIAALASVALSACSSPLPTPGNLPDIKEAQKNTADRFVNEGPPAIERIKVAGSSMRPQTARPPVPQHIAEMPIDVNFPGNLEANVGTLVQTMSAVNLQVGFQWTNSTTGEEILARKLPFLGFQGTVGELLSSLRTGIGIVAWYENGMVFLSDKERYSVALPQNEELLQTVTTEITSLGATDVVSSVRGGKILYSATPTIQDDLIGPFLKRLSRNLAVVNLQIAVVSLALNDKAAQGVDWNAFSASFDSSAGGIDGVRNPKPPEPPSSDDEDGDVSEEPTRPRRPLGRGSIVDLTAGGIALSKTSLGNVFGTYGALTITGAISFLSNFGTTNITQNVSLKTLSGSEVTLRSGQEVPYVTGVSSTSNSNSSNTTGSTQTDKVQTGLTLKSTPQFDADAGLVTLTVDVELKSILDFIELNAGRDIGTLTQPMTQDQSLTDIVRVQAGKTVVIGGLQFDNESKNGVEPAFIRDRLEKAGRSIGQRSHDIQRNALFIVLRPSVTIYETGE